MSNIYFLKEIAKYPDLLEFTKNVKYTLSREGEFIEFFVDTRKMSVD